MVLIKNKNINNVMLKYSNAYIISYFNNYLNSKQQISTHYQNDIIFKNILINDVISRHMAFRDALLDPTDPINAIIIQRHHEYFFDKNIISNGQIRGPQVHLSHQMFSDFGFAGNGIERTNLNADYLSSFLKTKNINIIHTPVEMSNASPHSFRQSIEVSIGKMYSSVVENEVYLTNDDFSKVNSFSSFTLHNNMPFNQKVGDAVSKTKLKNVYVQSEFKFQTPGVSMSNNNIDQSRVISIGTTDPISEENNVRILAQRAMMGFINIKHIDPKLNNPIEKNFILKKLDKTGDIKHAQDLIGFPIPISNKHNE